MKSLKLVHFQQGIGANTANHCENETLEEMFPGWDLRGGGGRCLRDRRCGGRRSEQRRDTESDFTLT